MKKLLEGLHTFKEQVVKPQADFFKALSEGQNPETLFITCSDSRIVPDLITQTQPGDLFIIRNAGNMVPPYGSSTGGVIGTTEYAVAILGVKHIVVCGHSHCGAIGGILNPESVAPFPAVSNWLEASGASVRHVVESKYAHLSDEDRVNIATQENVLKQITNLQGWPFIAERLEQGMLELHAWVYKIESGDVYSYDPHIGQFVSIAHHSQEAIGHLHKRPELLNANF